MLLAYWLKLRPKSGRLGRGLAQAQKLIGFNFLIEVERKGQIHLAYVSHLAEDERRN
jgi:hypothetical protein